MADNIHKYGFRWWAGNPSSCPAPQYFTVATGQDHQDDTSTSVIIRVGDPMKLVSTGGVNIALTTNSVYGICTAIAPVWDGSKMAFRRTFPNQNSWGTIEARRPWIGVVPAKAGIWEIDADEKMANITTPGAETFAGWVSFINENVEHAVPGSATLDPAGRVADPMLDMDTHATTAGLGWRIVGVSSSLENKDFSGSFVKLLVTVNESQEAGSAATNVAGV